MKRTKLLEEIRKMRFEETYRAWTKIKSSGRARSSAAADLTLADQLVSMLFQENIHFF